MLWFVIFLSVFKHEGIVFIKSPMEFAPIRPLRYQTFRF